jgi:cell division protein FtsB
LSKAANTYWDNGRAGKGKSSRRVASSARTENYSARAHTNFVPKWFVMVIPVLLSALLVLTLNVRAWTNVQTEYQTNQKLGAEIEQLTNENQTLQDEVNRLQYDPKMIEREARKLGMGRANEKVFVPTQ